MNVEEYIKSSKEIPLRKKTLIHILLINNKIKEVIGSTLKSFDVSLPQYNVLRILRGQNGKPANLSTLNERMISKMSNTTRLVDKLILKKLVNRVVSPSNRRKVEIFITNEGIEVLEKMDKAVEKAECSITKKLENEDLKSLNILLDKI